jgi:WD40 repeat protein
MSNYRAIFLVTLLLFGCAEPKLLTPSERFEFSDQLLLSGQLSEDGHWVLLLTESADLSLYDIRSASQVLSLDSTILPRTVRAVLLNKSQGIILVAGNNVVQIWEITRAKLREQFEISGFDELARVSALGISESGRTVAVGMTDGAVNIIHFSEKKAHRTVLHSSNIAYVNFINNDQSIVSASHDGYLKVTEVVTGNEIYSVSFPSRVSAVALNHDETRLFVSDSLKTQVIMDLENGEILTQFDYLSRFKWFRHALFITAAPYLLTSSAKSKLSLWHMDSGKEMSRWDIEAHSMGSTVLDMVELNNSNVMTLSSEGVIEVWNMNKAQFFVAY